MSRRIGFLVLLAAIFAGLLVAAASGFITEESGGDRTVSSTIHISTGEGGAGSADEFGLMSLWQQAYNGTSGTHDYKFNGSGTDVTEECGNCHMHTGGTDSKHQPPFHPIGLNSSDTGEWFFDDDTHRGPNTQLADQLAGIQAKGSSVYCSDCHSPQNASGFAESANSDRSNDPHSIHNDVMTREGCIRCHNYDDTTFSGSVTFTQGNATRDTYGIANPINMTRVWDGKFISIDTEAKYNSTLSTTGSGWNKYGTADNASSTQYACGDCHGQYHDAGGLGFAFDDAASSRKGPYALVNDTNSIGITSGGNNFTCGDCHVTDAHAVHTNGGIVTATNYSYAQGTTTDPAIHNSSARGAEYCDESHSQNIDNSPHSQDPEAVGLSGAKNNLPDARADETGYSSDTWTTTPAQDDCGFCHT